MARYSEELMEQTVRKMMPPHGRSMASISRESGISAPTLYAWKAAFEANEDDDKVSRRELAVERRKRQKLEKELHRKEKALTEAVALSC